MTTQNPPEAPFAAPNSSMAIVSLVTGILGLTVLPGLGSIIAVITANMAKKEIRESRGALGGEGLATAGAVMGWIGIGLGVVAVCMIGVAILLPILMVVLGLSTEGSSLGPVIMMLL